MKPPAPLILSILIVLSPIAAGARVEDIAAGCAGCHGEEGIPQDKKIPIIWGQIEGYVYIQLRDFARGTRKNESMSQIASTLDRQTMFDLAAYFAAKRWPDLGQPRASSTAAGRAVAIISSIGCTGCHLERFQGTGTAPRLAGQSEAYLLKTLEDFRSGERGNNPGMTGLMRATDADSFPVLAAYLAGL